MVLACIVSPPFDNQQNSQVRTGNFLGFGTRQIQYELVSYLHDVCIVIVPLPGPTNANASEQKLQTEER
jgi:hypothetical protein